LDVWRRDWFQIWPQVPHRQYVASLMDLLVVLTLCDRQNGHAAGFCATGFGVA